MFTPSEASLAYAYARSDLFECQSDEFGDWSVHSRSASLPLLLLLKLTIPSCPRFLIQGLWGMNVKVPGQDVLDNLHWFFSIVGCLIGFALIGGFVTYRLFKN